MKSTGCPISIGQYLLFLAAAIGMGKDKVKWPPRFIDLMYFKFHLQGHVEPKLCAVRVSNAKHHQKQTTSLCHKITPFSWTDKNICAFMLVDILSTL